MNRIFVTLALVLLGALGQSFGNRNLSAAESVGRDSSASSELEMTIRRFFASQSGYQVGDLITRSQVKELQVYLRRTRRRGPACRPQILHRILPDDCRLSRVFYLKNGGNVLREAAQRLGGYAILEALARSTTSYAQLIEAVGVGSVEAVAKLVESTGLEQRLATAKAEGKQTRRRKIIYTVDEFLNAVRVTSKEKTPAESR